MESQGNAQIRQRKVIGLWIKNKEELKFLELNAGGLPRGAYFFELIGNDKHRLGQGRFVVQ